MQGIFSNFWLRDDLGLQRMCCYKTPLGIRKKFDYLYETPREAINLNLDERKRKEKRRRYNLMNKFKNRKEEQSDNILHLFALNCHFLVKYDIEWLTCNVT